jgi:hypothetical protein
MYRDPFFGIVAMFDRGRAAEPPHLKYRKRLVKDDMASQAPCVGTLDLLAPKSLTAPETVAIGSK